MKARRRLTFAFVMSGDTGIRDLLTGLYTRDYFDEVIGQELERSRRHDIALSVLSVVIVNRLELEREGPDVFGAALGAAAKALQLNVRGTDSIFRWEDDEFVILLFEADADACRKKVQQLSTLFSIWREGNGPLPYPIKIRIGASTHEKDIVFPAVLQAAREAARHQTRV